MTLRIVHPERRFVSGVWLVRVTSTAWLPGDLTLYQLFEVQESGHVLLKTIDIARVRRLLGDEAYAELEETEL